MRGGKPFEHWVSRIAVTCCYDWLRKQRARPATTWADLSEDEAEILSRSLSSGGEGGLEVRRELLNGLLDRLIEGLKPRERLVIRLLDLEERSVKEVSELTGWGESKVKMTALRARRRLAQQLEHLERDRRGRSTQYRHE